MCRVFRSLCSLSDGLAFLVCDGKDAAFVAALEVATGKARWKVDRRSDAKLLFSFATPHVVTGPDGKRVLVSPASDYCFGYDPATGAERWRCKYPEPGWSLICRPVFARDKNHETNLPAFQHSKHGISNVQTGFKIQFQGFG